MIPLDPLHFEKLSLNQGGPSPVSINLTFYDMDLIGSSSIDVDQARFVPFSALISEQNNLYEIM